MQKGENESFEKDPRKEVQVQKPIHPPAVAPEEILDHYLFLKVDANDEVILPEPHLLIGSELISSVGNIVTISGAPKSGKSSVMNYIITGGISFIAPPSDNPITVLCNSENKAVIHFDTEQSRFKHVINVKHAILGRLGLEEHPDHFLSYNLRQLDLSEYKKTVDDILEAASFKYRGIHSIFIDGIADFIESVNDEVLSRKVVGYFMKKAADYKTVIYLIVHTNPGGDKQRGHLGSELQRKSEAVINVKKTTGFSYLEAQFLRNGDEEKVPKLKFIYDEEKQYHILEGVYEQDKTEAKESQLRALATKVMMNPPVAFTDLVNRIVACGEGKTRTAKNRISSMLELNILQKDEAGKYEWFSEVQGAEGIEGNALAQFNNEQKNNNYE